ncbi:MAG TPA: M20 family metallopeptidase [Desertimonas sp.]|nr:M20 family metallopeptidase [Desertimonas sp.]
MIDGDALVEFTRELVRIPSVYDPARRLNEQPAAEAVEAQMRAFGWSPRVDLVAAGRPNVIATIDGDRPGRTLLFEGHTDVVTEGDEHAWTVDPFGAELRDGRIYGRGSADMKSGVAAMLFAADAVVRAGSFPGRIVVAALVDEEGMMSGVRDFVARGHAEGIDGAICCEPEGGEICTTAKGAMRLRIDLTGKMAHGAMPFEGRNPNRAAAMVIAALTDLERRLQDVHGEHEQLGQPWITPTVLRAGEPAQMNVMPGTSALWVDVRTVPAVDHERLLTDIEQLASDITRDIGVTTAVTVLDDRPPVELASNHTLVRAVWDAHTAVGATPARLGGVPGTTDGTMLTALAGVPTVVYGPGGKWIAHQADEYVDVADIVEHANVYVATAERFL